MLDPEKDADVWLATVERASLAMYSHWDALLTANGIMVGIASIFAAIGKFSKYPALILIACAVISSTLLVWNFNGKVASTQRALKGILSAKPSGEQFTERLQQIADESKQRNCRTRIAQFMVLAEIVILIIMLYEI